MGTPSYLLKKHDTYYFRQAWPNSLKPVIGQREIVRSCYRPPIWSHFGIALMEPPRDRANGARSGSA